MVSVCPCIGGAQGVQTCTRGGQFEACLCPDGAVPDAPPAPDAAAEAATPDVSVEDSRAPDAPASPDALVTTDTPSPVDAPAPMDAREPDAVTPADVGSRGPTFLSFGTNVTSVTEGGSVTFTAVLSDPDGSADLVGGALLDEAGVARYGAFMASGGTGAYTLTITWAQMHAVASIDFVTEQDRRFLVEFFDIAGNRVTRTVPIRLQCNGRGGSACAGRCTDLTTSSNCGRCGRACFLPTNQCVAGECSCGKFRTLCGGQCVYTDTNTSHCGGCGVTCSYPGNPRSDCLDGACQYPSSPPLGTSCATICARQTALGRPLGCRRCPVSNPSLRENQGTAQYNCSVSSSSLALTCDQVAPPTLTVMGMSCTWVATYCCCG